MANARHPDNPMQIDMDFLQRIDKDPPGTWIAQPKLDGWRRLAFHGENTWEIRSKHKDGPASKAWPNYLSAMWLRIPWPAGIGFDMEWVGPHRSSQYASDSVWIFDLIQLKGRWVGSIPFVERYAKLNDVWSKVYEQIANEGLPVHLTPTYRNPGLPNFFLQQLQDPISEGIVVRRHDSRLIGSMKAPADNPMWFKVKFKRAESTKGASHGTDRST